MSYYQLATDLALRGVKVAAIESNYGLVFRQGKGIDDIVHAIEKAKSPRNGLKIENQIGMLEVYLKQVLKRSKKGNNESRATH